MIPIVPVRTEVQSSPGQGSEARSESRPKCLNVKPLTLSTMLDAFLFIR